MSWQKSHLLVGALALVLFVLQGQYMVRVLDSQAMADGPRMMYRTAHIYLLFAAALNVFYGYLLGTKPISGLLQRGCSVVLLLSPVFFTTSFLLESTAVDLERPITVYTLFGIFGSAVILLILHALQRK